MRWNLQLLAVACGTLLVAGCGIQSSTSTAAPIPGHIAPGFSLTSLSDGGKTISLHDLTHNNKPILLNAFASWCDQCQQETPDLVRMASKYASRVQFVGVNMTQDDNTKDAASFVKKYGIKYPVLLDQKGVFMHEYNVTGLPTTFLLSSTGKVLSVHLGYLSGQQMQTMMVQALGH